MTIPDMDFDKDENKDGRWTEECDRLDASNPNNNNLR